MDRKERCKTNVSEDRYRYSRKRAKRSRTCLTKVGNIFVKAAAADENTVHAAQAVGAGRAGTGHAGKRRRRACPAAALRRAAARRLAREGGREADEVSIFKKCTFFTTDWRLRRNPGTSAKFKDKF